MAGISLHSVDIRQCKSNEVVSRLGPKSQERIPGGGVMAFRTVICQFSKMLTSQEHWCGPVTPALGMLR